MANKDDNLFEDVPFQAEAPAQGDADLFEDKLFDEETEVTSSEEESLPSKIGEGLLGAAGGGAVGYGAGKVIQAGANLFDKAMSSQRVGRLDKDQMDFVTQKPNTYRGADTLENLMSQWKNLAQDVSTTAKGASKHYETNLKKTLEHVDKAAYDKAEVAKASLKTEAPMPKEVFYQGIGEGLLKAPGAVSEITPEAKKEFFKQNFEIPFASEQENLKLQEVSKRLEYLKANAPAMETFKGTDVYNKFQNDLRIAEQNLADEVNQIKEKLARQTVEKFKAASGIPKELREAVPALENKILDTKAYKKMVENAVEMARNPLVNLEASKVGDKFGIIPQLREGVDFNKSEASTINDFAQNLSESTRAKAGELYPTYDENMKASSRAIEAKEALGKSGVKMADEGSFLSANKANNIYKWLANPEQFPDEIKQLKAALGQTTEFSQNQPLDFVQERLAQADRLEKNMEQLGVRVDPNSNVELKNNAESRLAKLATNQASPEAQKLAATIDEARTISSNPDMKSGQQFLDEVKAANIKDIVNQPSIPSNVTMGKAVDFAGKAGIGGVIGGHFGGGTGAAVGAGTGMLLDVYGTKLQEFYALQKATKMGKGLKALGDLLPPGLGVAGAALGAAGAVQAGELSPTEGAIGTAMGAIEPPMTDTVEGLIQAKKAAADVQGQQTDEDIELAQDLAISGDLGANPAQDILLANPVNKAAIKGFAKGFTSPIPNLAGLATEVVGEGLNKLGTEQSNAARSRMEQRFKEIKPQTDKKNDVLQGSDNLKQASNDDLLTLSQTLSGIKGAERFVAPLENAANASTKEEKQARLFGLYQQPAFRALLNKGKKLES